MKHFVTYILFLTSFFTCKNDDSTEMPWDFNLVILNDGNMPDTSFPEGSDPVFALEIFNHSDKNLVWYNYCKIFNDKDLYNTYAFTRDDSGGEGYLFVGKPFQSPVNCEDKPLTIGPGKGYYFKIPWSFNPANVILTSGDYKVQFDLEINVNDNHKKTKSFLTTFQVHDP
jgi:hypothetical protein